MWKLYADEQQPSKIELVAWRRGVRSDAQGSFPPPAGIKKSSYGLQVRQEFHPIDNEFKKSHHGPWAGVIAVSHTSLRVDLKHPYQDMNRHWAFHHSTFDMMLAGMNNTRPARAAWTASMRKRTKNALRHTASFSTITEHRC
ncbi:hypothetical protein SNOG_00650 [Parastagonospora nodorum SN15]|uniref:Uncharacterized protein n=1 Tax=Phaeosphaeria nodorum (strain SN15 / ATCC MYA-4574 / FGSC 10173) TaxID=321614 RepID=Q0V5R4_PHANO|nr:hypothetical protein SNOG_00650 [Parastagonospora nodorum SN15]EAT92145.1 hypothetical protein SNOG_00650 [Parastagonospora nodorum SN15]